MKRAIVILLFSGVLPTAWGQSEYSISDLSDKLYAKIVIDKDGNGTATIFRKGDNARLLQTEGNQFDFDFKPGQKSVPYKNQSVIVYEDFNFDGVKDLAIQEFYSTKGPGYNIFLFLNNSFKKDDVFSGIIQESQGNYTLDPTARTISTMNSGGCCSHSSALYGVKDGKPFQIKEQSEEIAPPFTTVITREWKDGKKTEITDKTLSLENDPIVSFLLASNKKKILLFSTNDRTLNYALVKADDKVEFNFPATEVYKNPDFRLSPSRNELVFKNKSAEYKIYERVTAGKIEAVGIIVKTGGKEYDLKGDIMTLKGRLNDIGEMDNVVK